VSRPGPRPPVDPPELVTAYQRSAVVAAACGTTRGPAAGGGRRRRLPRRRPRPGRARPGAIVLDLPAVEPVLRERHPELAFVAGDLDLPRFGRPAGERWDAVLLANVLHDHAWTADQLTGWLDATGLVGAQLRRRAGPIAVVAARAPGR
jgi:hypothetical protein